MIRVVLATLILLVSIFLVMSSQEKFQYENTFEEAQAQSRYLQSVKSELDDYNEAFEIAAKGRQNMELYAADLTNEAGALLEREEAIDATIPYLTDLSTSEEAWPVAPKVDEALGGSESFRYVELGLPPYISGVRG